ncbi:MAG TPA: AMP-binding protein [Bryobacteraceae bacterium]|nr:AMP-binding protein [Bryobacteraceae bacterium]
MCSVAALYLCRSNRPALLAAGRATLTFAHLADYLERTSARLRELGIRRHDVVASVLADGPDCATAALATSAIARFAPLDSNLSRPEYEAIFFELTPKVVFLPAGKSHPAREAAHRWEIPVVEVISHDVAGLFTLKGRVGAAGRVSEAARDDVALILTLPGGKFAPITHGNLLAAIDSIPVEPDSSPSLAPLHEWRGLVQGVFAPLCAGATVAFTGTESVLPPAQAEAPPIACNEVAVIHGELAARGPAVIPAYFRNRAATRDAFRDGWFFLTGRADTIRNGRLEISPLEIDEALLSHPDVEQAIAFPVPDPKFGQSAAAAVVLSAGSSAGPAGLKRFVSTHLARFKVPERILVLDTIPRVARSALARALGIKPSSHSAKVFPIQPEGIGAPLFTVDPCDEFASERPVFGIRLPELAKLPPPHTVEHVAAECIHALRRFQPEGPYAIGGWDAIAIEMARQLEQAGEQVDLVELTPRHGRVRRLIDCLAGFFSEQQMPRHDRPQLKRDRPLPAGIAVE